MTRNTYFFKSNVANPITLNVVPQRVATFEARVKRLGFKVTRAGRVCGVTLKNLEYVGVDHV